MKRPRKTRAVIPSILCAGKSQEHVELLELDKSSIRVAEYVTELPPPEVLGRKLQSAIAAARSRVDALPPELAPGEPGDEPPSSS